MQSNPTPLVGVTGGIGSGKTTVCKCFEVLGRTVLYADHLARELTEKDEKVRSAIGQRFGADIFGPDGSLRRKELAAIVFADKKALRDLNAIVHPRVFTAIDQALDALPASRRLPYVVIEAALIFESRMDKQLAATVVVRAAEELRVARIISRDGTPRESIVARMRAQMSPEETAKRADFVIDNEAPEEGLLAKVKFIDTVLSAMFHRSGVMAGSAYA